MPQKAKKKQYPTIAETADRHYLYEKSVQNTALDYKFVNKVFRKLRDRRPTSLREDFCGTARMCREWVSRRKSNTAIGVDLDPEVLSWGRQHNINRLTPDQQLRVQLKNEDVLTVEMDPVDLVMATNFSYQLFKDRKSLGHYFKRVREGLVDDGIFFLDAYGGYESFKEQKEKTKHKKFTYVWDQAKYNPITGDMTCHIHFHFADGSKLKKAFTYDWRMWTLPEVQELLHEAGFNKITVYWEGEDKHGEGNGKFKPTTVADADAAWVCYITAEK
jgi:hypothetical protein